MRDKNSSEVSIEDSNINGIDVTIETSTEGSIKALPINVSGKKSHVPEEKEGHSLTVTSVDTNLSHEHAVPWSAPSIDTNPSRKYAITLTQARKRILRAIIKAKKRSVPLDIED